jgi:hypothetical protein
LTCLQNHELLCNCLHYPSFHGSPAKPLSPQLSKPGFPLWPLSARKLMLPISKQVQTHFRNLNNKTFTTEPHLYSQTHQHLPPCCPTVWCSPHSTHFRDFQLLYVFSNFCRSDFLPMYMTCVPQE